MNVCRRSERVSRGGREATRAVSLIISSIMLAKKAITDSRSVYYFVTRRKHGGEEKGDEEVGERDRERKRERMVRLRNKEGKEDWPVVFNGRCYSTSWFA